MTADSSHDKHCISLYFVLYTDLRPLSNWNANIFPKNKNISILLKNDFGVFPYSGAVYGLLTKSTFSWLYFENDIVGYKLLEYRLNFQYKQFVLIKVMVKEQYLGYEYSVNCLHELKSSHFSKGKFHSIFLRDCLINDHYC